VPEGNDGQEPNDEANSPASSTLRAAAQLVLGPLQGPGLSPTPSERSAADVLTAQRELQAPGPPLPDPRTVEGNAQSDHGSEEEDVLTAYPDAVVMKDPRQRGTSEIGLVGFSHPGHDEAWDVLCGAGFLSNFYDLGSNSLPVEVPNNPGNQCIFLSAEAAFQAIRHWPRAKQFQHLNAGDAFRLSRHLSGQEDWTYGGFGSAWEGMASILRIKFARGTAMAKALLTTKDSFLLHHNTADFRDALWSDNGDGEGKNLLGMQLMLIRDELSGNYGWTDFIRRICGVDLQSGSIPETEEEPWQETVRIARVALVSKLPVTKSTVAQVRAVMQKQEEGLESEEDPGQLLSRGELALIRMLTTPGNRLSMMLNDLASKDDEEEDKVAPEGDNSMSGGDVLQPLPQFPTRLGSAEARRTPMRLPRSSTTSDLEARRLAAEKAAAEAEKANQPKEIGKEASVGSKFPLSLAPAIAEAKDNKEEATAEANESLAELADQSPQPAVATEVSKQIRFKGSGGSRANSMSSVGTKGYDGSPQYALSVRRRDSQGTTFGGSVWSDIPDWDKLRGDLPEGKAELNAHGRIPAIFSVIFWIVASVGQLLANVFVYTFNEVPEKEKLVVEAAVMASKNIALEALLPALDLAQTLDVATRMGTVQHLSDYEGLLRVLQPHFDAIPALREVEIVDVLPESLNAAGNETYASYASMVVGGLVPRSFLMYKLANGSTHTSSDRDDCTLIPGRRGCALEPLGSNNTDWYEQGLALDPVSSVVERLPVTWVGPTLLHERGHLQSCRTFCWHRGLSLVTRVYVNSTMGGSVPAPVVRISLDVEHLLAALARVEQISQGEAMICTREGAILASTDMANTVWVDRHSGVIRSADTWEFPRQWAKGIDRVIVADADRTLVSMGSMRVSVWPLDGSDYGAAALGSLLRMVVAVPTNTVSDSVFDAMFVPTVVVAALPVLAVVLLTLRGMVLRWRGGGQLQELGPGRTLDGPRQTFKPGPGASFTNPFSQFAPRWMMKQRA